MFNKEWTYFHTPFDSLFGFTWFVTECIFVLVNPLFWQEEGFTSIKTPLNTIKPQ